MEKEEYIERYMALDIDTSRENIIDFLNKNAVGVLATADATGKPHAATIYVTHDQLLNLYFVTKKETQKGRNLAVNPRASIALYDAVDQTTIQVDGDVTEVTDQIQQTRIFSEIQSIALRTSTSGVPPTSELSAGGYVTYELSSPTVRKAIFGRSNAQETTEVFETVM